MELEAYGAAVRRVGFRFGTDAELAAMHLVESEIEAERRPGASPQPLESYIAFARHLPSQFDDHTWLAETNEGTPIGCSACWSNSAGDPTVMESYVYVRKPWRRRGVGWQLTRPIIDTAEAEGRASLVGNAFDDQALAEAGRQRWTIFIRDIDGRCVGGTEVTFEPWDATVALQQSTAIGKSHRGLGLAKLVKASMLDRIRRDRSEVERVRTSNAFSNAPMLAINNSLGFKIIEVRAEWQGQTVELRRALCV